METFEYILNILGFIIRAVGFAALGFGVARFLLDAYYKSGWQAQVALAAGFFLLLVGLTHYSSPASMGMFATSAGAALIMRYVGKKEEAEAEDARESSKKK